VTRVPQPRRPRHGQAPIACWWPPCSRSSRGRTRRAAASSGGRRQRGKPPELVSHRVRSGHELWWKVALPSGNSSPCIWDEAIFVTAHAEPDHRVLRLNALTGELGWSGRSLAPRARAWQRAEQSGLPDACTDGERVISYFGRSGRLPRFRRAGALAPGAAEPATNTRGHVPGAGGRPGDPTARQDVGSHLLALDKRSGETVWRTERPDFRGILHAAGFGHRPDALVIAPGTLRIVAYDARSGSDRWRVVGLPNEVCASPVAGDGLIFCAGWTPGAGVPRMPDFDSLLAAGDRNGDGRLARDEVPSGPAAQHFNYVDADRDGTLSRAEYEFIAGVFQHSQNALLAVRSGGDGRRHRDARGLAASAGAALRTDPLLYHGRLYLVKNGGC